MQTIDILDDEDTFLASTAFDYPYDPYTPYRPGNPDIPWYRPATAEFWTAAGTLLNGMSPSPADLADNSPAPHPEFGQIPPL